jgi:hypothetical protein
MMGLRGLGARLDRCGDPNAATGFGGSVAQGQGTRARTLIILDIETLDGEARVLDAKTDGSASDAFVACARDALRGHAVTVRAARAGGRLRLALPVGSRTDPSADEAG